MSVQFNKAQRTELSDLSTKLFGASSRWQKMLKNKSYWVPTGQTETKENKNYFICPGQKKGKTATLMTVQKAVSKGLLPAADKEGRQHEETYESTRQVLRAPTYEELKETLTHMVDSKAISLLMHRGKPEDVRFVYAYRFAKEDLRYSFGLQKTLNVPEDVKSDPVEFQKATVDAQEVYDKDLDSLLETIDSETLVERINASVMDAEQFKKVGGFEAIDFVSDVVFCLKQTELAEEQYEAAMKEAELLLSSAV